MPAITYTRILLTVLLLTAAADAATTIRLATGLDRPVFVTAAPGDPDRLFIVEQWTARIRIYRRSTAALNPAPFLDINSLVIDSGNERGLLGLAFHPGYEQNGRLFVYYIDNQNASVVARYQVSAANPDSAVAFSAEVVIRIPQPAFSNHKAGMIGFGPLDSLFYIALGDGGDAGDPGNRAQSDTTLLGKILRLDVDALPYTIPPGNPFASNADGVRDEIWSKGLRNPWRWSFDRANGAMYIADVGQGRYEEVNVEPPLTGGRNYGWRLKEGAHCYNPDTLCDPGGLTDPVYEYSHDFGCSITGGYVYRGCAIPELRGHYFFADYCSNRIWSLRYDSAGVHDVTERTTELHPAGGLSIDAISSFGEDGQGELYVCDLTGGEIFQIVPTTLADTNGNGIADGCECPERAVTDLVILLADNAIALDWTATPGIRYRVYRAASVSAPFPGGSWTLLLTTAPGVNHYTDATAPDGGDTSFYVVTALCP